MKTGTVIILVGVLAVGGIWLYTRSQTTAVVGGGGGGGGGLLGSLESLGVSTGTQLAGQGISAGLGAATSALNGSGSDGDDSDSDDGD
jgi:hypothetical protein